MDADAARLALSPAALELLESLPPYTEADALSLGGKLRAQGHEPALVAVVLTQSRLRAAAAAKFGEFARGMLFTQAGLEQATRLVVAARHAARFRDAAVDTVIDLTAGLGADAMAMAALELGVIAFEVDEATALIADHNLRHWPRASVVLADSLETLARGEVTGDAVWADPARRTAHGRTHNPRDYAPPLDEVLALRGRYPALGMKLGPAIAHEALPGSTPGAPVEAQWVSVDGDVVEAAVWCGPLARTEGHSALVLRGGAAHVVEGSTERAPVGALEEWILEPDGAVIRSGLVGVVAEQTAAHLIDEQIAYLTSPTPPHSPLVAAFRVLEAMPYSERTLAGALKARGIGTLEIKKRGIDIAPETLRTRLGLKGSNSATVILTRVANKRMALIVERTAADA